MQAGRQHRHGRVDHGKNFWKAVSASLSQWHGHRTLAETHIVAPGAYSENALARSTPGRLPDSDNLTCQAQRSYSSSYAPEVSFNNRTQSAPRTSSALYSPSPSQLLNSSIDRCTSTASLALILQQDHASLDAVHLCKMMTKLLRLAPRKRDPPASHAISQYTQTQPASPKAVGPSLAKQSQTELVHQLAIDISSAALEFQYWLTPRHCSTLLSGLSQCISPSLPTPHRLIQILTTRAIEQATSATVHDLVQLLHAVAALNASPTLPQLTILLVQLLQHAHLQRQEQAPRVGPQDVSMTLWSLATMQQHPGPVWLDSFLLCCAPQLPDYRPQALANTVWAVATLGHQPPVVWMEQALTSAHAALPSYPPQELSNLLWALATLRYVPPTDFLADAWQQLHDRCASLNAQDVSNALWACSQFGHRPAAPVLAVLAAHATSQIHSYSPQAICNVLEAFRRLKVSTPGQMLHAALTAAATSSSSSSSLSGRDIASLLTSVAGTCVSGDSLSSPGQELELQPVSEITVLTAADGRLLQKLLFSCCARPSGDFSSHDLVLVGQAVAGLRKVLQPDERWVQWWLVSTLPKMRSSRGRQLSRLCDTAASLHTSPPAAWLDACMQAMAHRMSDLQPSDLVMVCGALKSLSHPSPSALDQNQQAGYGDGDGDNLRGMQQQTASQHVFRLALPDHLMFQMRRQVVQYASDFSVRQMSLVVRSMAVVESAASLTEPSDSPPGQLQRWQPSGKTSKLVVRPKAVKRKAWRLMRKMRYRALPGGVAGRLAGNGSGKQVLTYTDSGIQRKQQHEDAMQAAFGLNRNGQQRGLKGPDAQPQDALMMQHSAQHTQQQQPIQQHSFSSGSRFASQTHADMRTTESGSREHQVSDDDLREELTVWYGIACLLSLSTGDSKKKLGQLCSLKGLATIPQHLPIARVQSRLAAQSMSHGQALRLGA